MVCFKSCPRCNIGDLVIDRDIYGWSALCLQCGYIRDIQDESEARALLERYRFARDRISIPA